MQMSIMLIPVLMHWRASTSSCAELFQNTFSAQLYKKASLLPATTPEEQASNLLCTIALEDMHACPQTSCKYLPVAICASHP